MHRFRKTLRRVIAAVAATIASIGLPEARQAPSLDEVLDRLGGYILDYETKVFELAAEEQFEQWIKRRPGYGQEVVGRRRLKSTFFLVRLPDGHAWYGFRDVSSVDGRSVPRPERSMEQVLGEGTVNAYDEALRVSRENAKYNIGPVYRTINLPLQAIELLHPQNRTRFDFAAAGMARVAGQRAIQIDFSERGRPTIVNDGFGGDRPARGRVWVDPMTGAVLRTQLEFGGEATPSFLADALIRVEYRRDKRLNLLLPFELEETYGLKIEVLHGRASYRNYRRFQTTARLVAPGN